MAFRFQKRIKLLPGVTFNLSRKGVSTSLGTTGARVTLGHGQQRTTVGLPGSGISHTSIASTRSEGSNHQAALPNHQASPARSPQRTARAQASGRWLAAFLRGFFGK